MIDDNQSDARPFDLSVLSDLGVLVGVIGFVRGLVQVNSALAWMVVGAALVLGSVIAVLPPRRATSHRSSTSTIPRYLPDDNPIP